MNTFYIYHTFLNYNLHFFTSVLYVYIFFSYHAGLFKNLPSICHSIYTKVKEPKVDRWAGCQGTTNLLDHEISSFLFTKSFFHMLRSLHHCVYWFGDCSGFVLIFLSTRLFLFPQVTLILETIFTQS